jgi:transcriptional regulator with XRE-family HTH domain
VSHEPSTRRPKVCDQPARTLVASEIVDGCQWPVDRPITDAGQTDAPMTTDNDQLGDLFRLLRRQAGLTQETLSIATSIPIRDINNLEAGRAGDVLYGRLNRLFTEVEARARMSVWWKGAAADRLLDERHAAIVEQGASIIGRYSWATPTEVTFSEFGERGSIDVFAHREEYKAVAVCEIKSAFGSLEEMNRSLDAKVRLAPKLCQDRFGWTPRHVARLLIVPGISSTRRIVAAHRYTMDQLYPARGREIRAWLRRPDRSIGGVWFLSDPRNTSTVPEPEE